MLPIALIACKARECGGVFRRPSLCHSPADEAPKFSAPLHFLDLPKGYEGSRRVALKHVDKNSKHFHAIPTPHRKLKNAIGAREALEDLPKTKEHALAPTIIRRRKLGDMLPYHALKHEISDYALMMRTWSGSETDDSTNGHLVRLTPRDFATFAKMKHGGDYPHARDVAEGLFAEAAVAAGLARARKDSKAYRELHASIVPPYDPNKFPNKWWKLHPAKPSRTLTAHMGKDTYRIYNPNDVRGDTFPDAVAPPQPPKKGGRCGIFGTIILAVVAIAVAAFTCGALVGPMTSLAAFAGLSAGAAGATTALDSALS